MQFCSSKKTGPFRLIRNPEIVFIQILILKRISFLDSVEILRMYPYNFAILK